MSDPRTILVTGGAGFIGANFVRQRLAADANESIVVLDALTYAGNRTNLAGVDPERCIFVHGDIRDTALVERLLREHAIRTIVHFAAESHVDRSITGPDAFIDTNVNGTHSLLKAARRRRVAERAAHQHNRASGHVCCRTPTISGGGGEG